MRYEAILYFDGPMSKWRMSARAESEPDAREVLGQRAFRWRFAAEIWAASRAKIFARVKYIVVPRP